MVYIYINEKANDILFKPCFFIQTHLDTTLAQGRATEGSVTLGFQSGQDEFGL